MKTNYPPTTNALMTNHPNPDAQHLKVFTDNAFFLLAHSETILADRRMAAAIVRNNLPGCFLGGKSPAYMTLGAYLYMWSNRPSTTIITGGLPALIYWSTGNPGTGSNTCRVIRSDGSTATCHAPEDFLSIIRAFGSVFNWYRETKDGTDPYSLEQVVEMLRAETLDSLTEKS